MPGQELQYSRAVAKKCRETPLARSEHRHLVCGSAACAAIGRGQDHCRWLSDDGDGLADRRHQPVGRGYPARSALVGRWPQNGGRDSGTCDRAGAVFPGQGGRGTGPVCARRPALHQCSSTLRCRRADLCELRAARQSGTPATFADSTRRIAVSGVARRSHYTGRTQRRTAGFSVFAGSLRCPRARCRLCQHPRRSHAGRAADLTAHARLAAANHYPAAACNRGRCTADRRRRRIHTASFENHGRRIRAARRRLQPHAERNADAHECARGIQHRSAPGDTGPPGGRAGTA